ncbi:MAG: tRNA (cytidine(34)-2'-O)-methyltransferase [Planctomycetota bacterium]
MFDLALYQPRIPQNVGNIARTCVGFDTPLHIIGPSLVDLSEKKVKRAGLDYWEDLRLTEHTSPEAFLGWMEKQGRRPWLVTKFGQTRFDRAEYAAGDVLVLGSETEGLPKAWHERFADRRLHIPIPGRVRSFNVANTAAIMLATGLAKAEGFPAKWEMMKERG